MSGRCCCQSCQKLSGAGNTENIAFAENAFTVVGDTTDYQWTADSGGKVTKSFCTHCGSPLFGKSTSMPGMKMVRVGALDDPSLYAPQMMVYAKRRHAWVQHDERLPAFETMPPLG
jgi:hypothetical protein